MGLRDRLRLTQEILDEPRREFGVADPAVAEQLAATVESFMTGYNGALFGEFEPDAIPLPLRGFAYEGAAMSLTVLDLLTLSRGRRVRALTTGEGARYLSMINIGAGRAFARLRLRPWSGVRIDGENRSKPVSHWLAWDGWGFHQAFFAPRYAFIDQRPGPDAVSTICDQGAGRALWYYAGADPDRVAAVIGGFPVVRQLDLWAGVGFAAAYTGGCGESELVDLRDRAGIAHWPHLAQGAAFAAKAHLLGGVRPDDAVHALTGATCEEAARWVDHALSKVSTGLDLPNRHDQWRLGVRRAWQRHQVGERI